MTASKALIQAVAATAELCGRAYSPAAAKLLVDDLAGFDEGAIFGALTRCRKDGLDARTFSVAAIIARLDDGRPGTEEAWAMLPINETTTVVWTDEMVAAWAVAGPLLAEGDRIAARMAFKEAYAKELARARDERRPPRWTASIGTDKAEADRVLKQAVAARRLSEGYVVPLLMKPMTREGMALLAGHKPKMIESTRTAQ